MFYFLELMKYEFPLMKYGLKWTNKHAEGHFLPPKNIAKEIFFFDNLNTALV